jgi:hypothetical protein
MKNNQSTLIKGLTASIAILLLPLITPIAGAESLVTKMDTMNQQSVETPRNGQKKDVVSTRYGEPKQKIAAVGEPPISKWVYQEFTVYFENDTVLHAVIHKS